MPDSDHGGTVEARIERICEMMRDLSFRTGKTTKMLAEEWGMSVSSVSKYANEASRRVRAEMGEQADYVSVNVGIALQTVIDGALHDIENPPMIVNGENAFAESPNKSRAMVIQAADKWAEITGAKAVQRIKVEVEKMSDEELAQRIAAVTARLKGE